MCSSTLVFLHQRNTKALEERTSLSSPLLLGFLSDTLSESRVLVLRRFLYAVDQAVLPVGSDVVVEYQRGGLPAVGFLSYVYWVFDREKFLQGVGWLLDYGLLMQANYDDVEVGIVWRQRLLPSLLFLSGGDALSSVLVRVEWEEGYEVLPTFVLSSVGGPLRAYLPTVIEDMAKEDISRFLPEEEVFVCRG